MKRGHKRESEREREVKQPEPWPGEGSARGSSPENSMDLLPISLGNTSYRVLVMEAVLILCLSPDPLVIAQGLVLCCSKPNVTTMLSRKACSCLRAQIRGAAVRGACNATEPINQAPQK